MYLADVKPKNLLRGQAVRVYLREDGRTIIKDVEIPHVIPSYKLENKVADTHIEALRNDKSMQGITFEQKRHKGNTVIHATGPREMKDKLPNIFMKSASSPTNIIRWRTNFPFSRIKEENGKLVFLRETEKVKELLNEKAVALDIEVEGWEEAEDAGDPSKERIAMASFVTLSDYGDFILSVYDFGAAEVEARGKKAKVIVCKDEGELIHRLSEMFKEYDPLWVFGSNVGGYDLLKLRERGNLYKRKKTDHGIFVPSCDSEEPKEEAQCGFFPRVTIRGRQVIDSAPFSQNWLWFPNNKLTTVANELMNEKEEKEMDYDELDKSFKSGDPARIARIAAYNLKDAIRSFETGMKILPAVIFQSKLFATSPSAACTTSKKSLGKNVHEKIYFEKYRTLARKIVNDKEYDDFNVDRLKYEIWARECGENSALSVKRGLFKEVDVVFLTPFIEAFKNVLRKQEACNELFKEYGERLDTIDRVILYQAMNAFLEKPLFDLQKTTGFRYVHSSFDISEKWDKAFGYSYGINSMVIHHSGEYRTNNIQSMNNRVLDAIVKTNNLLRSAEVINYSDRFIFVKDIAGTVDRLQELGLGRSLGKATVLSAEKGRVLFLMNNSKSGTILSQDADLSGMKGDRTVFEQEVICEFGRLAMMDRSAALNFLWSMAKGFADGRIPKEKLVYVSEHVQQDYFNYSAPAQLRERIATYIKYGVMKGDRFGYGYGKEKTPRLHIGSSNKGRIIKIPEFFSKNVEVEKEMYLDRWYGPKTKNGRSFSRGTVGDFVYAAFPVTSEEDRRELAKIVEGRRDAKIGKFFQEQLNLF